MTAYSSARTQNPLIVVVHTGEGILDKDDMVRFLDNNPNASAHAAADADGVAYGGVPDERAAWTAGPTANNIGLHIELCAFAQMTRAQWLSEEDVRIFVPWIGDDGEWRNIRKPRQMLRHAAAWVRAKADRHVIHVRKVGPSELRQGTDGICGHADTSAAWRETDHTDPGTGFPWDVFIEMVWGRETQQEEDDMFSDGDRVTLQELWADVHTMAQGLGERDIEPKKGQELKQVKHWYEVQHNLRNLLGMKPRGDYAKDQQGPLPAPGQDFELVKSLKELHARLDRIEKRIGLGDPNSPIRET